MKKDICATEAYNFRAATKRKPETHKVKVECYSNIDGAWSVVGSVEAEARTLERCEEMIAPMFDDGVVHGRIAAWREQLLQAEKRRREMEKGVSA